MEEGLISVDRFARGSQAYFLTHLHADHTRGLSPKWNYGSLFCSRVSAKLFSIKFPGFDLSLLRVLEIGHWYSIALVSPSSGSETTIKVISIDANHCPGSVMYLFRGEFGCMLFTGDFRWEKTSESATIGRTMLLNCLKNEKVNTLYIDNTYCNPTYSFPSREVAAQQVVDIITSYPEHDIIIAIDTLGKEELLLHISRALKIKIWVWPERLQVMHLLGYRDIFTTKTTLTRVRAVPRYSFNVETLEGLNTMRPTMGIMPSGLPWARKTVEREVNSDSSSTRHDRSNGNTDIDTSPNASKQERNLKTVERYHQYIYTVPYSAHSCFPEIVEFVKLINPVLIKGIVRSSPYYIEPHYHLRHLCGENQPTLSRICQKLVSDEEGERVECKKQPRHPRGCLTEGKRKRIRITELLGRRNRVCLLRRLKCGATLDHFDFTDD